ncbi:hypothetical protein GQX74_014617 [Glossina fuscipes]|nr:hypothetical protein GQX74_014617 [Glossina fuscipes]
MDLHLTHWSLLFVTLSCFLFYVFASESAKYVNQAASAINNEEADALAAVVKDVNEVVADVLGNEISSDEASNQETIPNLEKIDKLSQSSILMRESSITSSPLMELEDPLRPVKVSVDVLHSDSANVNNIQKLQMNNKNEDSIDKVDKLRTANIDDQSNALEVNDNAEKAFERDKDDRRIGYISEALSSRTGHVALKFASKVHQLSLQQVAKRFYTFSNIRCFCCVELTFDSSILPPFPVCQKFFPNSKCLHRHPFITKLNPA